MKVTSIMEIGKVEKTGKSDFHYTPYPNYSVIQLFNKLI